MLFGLALIVLPVIGAVPAVDLRAEPTQNQAADSTEDAAAKSKKEKEAAKRAAALDGLENQMRFAASSERKRAIRRVPHLKEEEKPRFLKLLDEFAANDLDDSVREVSLRTMGRAKYAAAKPTILKALDDDRAEVVMAAIAALNELKAKEAGAPLGKLLREADFSENQPTTTAAIRLLGRLENKELAGFLKEKAENDATHGEVRLAIVLYFGRAGATEMNGYLMDIVKDEQAEITTRAYAVNSVGKLGVRTVVPDLRGELDKIRNLANPRERARFSALKLQLLTALVRLGDDSVEGELLAAARDDDARVRVRAIGQIAEARMESARPLLKYIVDHDPSKSARAAATKALKKIDGDDSADEDDENETEDAQGEDDAS